MNEGHCSKTPKEIKNRGGGLNRQGDLFDDTKVYFAGMEHEYFLRHSGESKLCVEKSEQVCM